MRDCFVVFKLSKCQAKDENDRQNPLLIADDTGYATGSPNPTAAMTLFLKSWLTGHWFRYLILLMCSPLLIPIVCVIFPFLCAAEVCICLCRHRRRWLKQSSSQPAPVMPRHREDVQVKPKVSLLDRYLDDQLELALEILHECGGDLGYRYDNTDDFGTVQSSMGKSILDMQLCNRVLVFVLVDRRVYPLLSITSFNGYGPTYWAHVLWPSLYRDE
ncbi:hypothetical protein E3N88_40746 [Mikania micrantha]|uniref:Uncharacterized protein n=1 Tax=Mikania micrantha TaxID=192012 RepID=A0A5N6LNL2_9ASTR|nr:hypothetical protein E3N88_40746 [Mikania micrantha]